MYRLRFELPRAQARRLFAGLEAVEEPAFAAASLGEADAASLVVDIYLQQRPVDLSVLGLEAASLAGLQLAQGELTRLEDEDWVAKSQAGLAPVRAGRFLVHGSHDAARVGRRLWAIRIDAAQAFGTAHHGTTRGCLLAIDWLAHRRMMRAPVVFDMGTGSGVLAIAATKALRARVLASDNDGLALSIAAQNAAANGVGARMKYVQAAGFAHGRIRQAAPFSLIMANILAGPLQDMAPGFVGHLRAGGYVLLSGILDRQARRVRARYAAFGFVLVRMWSLEGWTTLLLRHA